MRPLRLDDVVSEVWRASLDLRAHLAVVRIRRLASELRYREDQPRAPRGNPEGGQWILDRVHVAAARSMAPRCDDCGDRDTSGLVKIGNKRRCWDCTIKYLGIQQLPIEEQLKTISDFDKDFKP